ncbi:MAG: hypothetical protein ABFD29_00285 [Anaerolineaceae bacterium]
MGECTFDTAYRVLLGRGVYPSLEALGALVPIVDQVAPNLDNQSIYRRQCSVCRLLYDSLKPVFNLSPSE